MEVKQSSLRENQTKELDDFGSKLFKAQSKRENKGKQFAQNKSTGNGLGLAFRVAVELVSAVMVGLGIGWLLDQLLNTQPWLMVIFLILGGVAGILNVYRQASCFADSSNNYREH